jgi:hypothetical protein
VTIVGFGGIFVSYSFREPEWPAFCECKYDEVRDELDREDCPFHCDLVDNTGKDRMKIVKRKKPTRTGDAEEPAA